MNIIRNKSSNMISHISISAKGKTFDVELRGSITVICGYSGTGKTYFSKLVRDFFMNNKNLLKSKYGVSNVYFWTYDSESIDMLSILKNLVLHW